MKGKAVFYFTLAMLVFLGGGSAIAANVHTADAAGLEIDSSDKVFWDKISIDRPIIDFPTRDSSGLDISLPIRPPIFDEGTVELPSHYCMRDEYVLYAQHQDKEGYCWNFAATMSASTTLMRHTGEYYDFSEAWNGLACLYTDNSYNKIGAGGHFSYQYDAIKYGGLMLESDFPYQETYTISSENADLYYNFFQQYSNDDLVDCLRTKSFQRTKVDDIKKHVYNYGSVYASFSFHTGYIADENGITALPPNQKNTTSAHAVSIIGWDDNYEREWTLDDGTTKVFKGAWLILNSYTENNGRDGISFVFYDDANLYGINGYTYAQKITKDLYFYDKIEEGYAYPTAVKGKYCGDFVAQEGETKQKNIFYDDVNLGYSYTISEGASIENIAIYLDNVEVTPQFDVRIDSENKRFYIEKENAQYGQYKVLVTYGNGKKSDTYLNNFFVTYGLFGEKQEFNTEANNLAFNTGRNLEYHSIIRSNKDYVIYTNQKSGTLEFLPIHQSVYSDKNMSIPALSYEITEGNSCVTTYTITSASGYEVNYNFHIQYYEDPSLQPVTIYYDLNGGVNHSQNYDKELANETTDLLLYAPTREGYVFDGWYVDYGDRIEKLTKKGELYYLDWDSIHHMGENPTLYASSYYKKYYANTNVAFVSASWIEAEYYDVTTEIIGEGTATPSGATAITSFDVLTYTFTPSEGYQIKDVKVDGLSVGAVAQYTFANVNCEHTISVEFEKKTFNVTLVVDGQGNATCNASTENVPFGENRTLVLSASEGWELASVYVNGNRVTVENNQLALGNITKETEVIVIFKKAESNVAFLATVIPLSTATLGSTGGLVYTTLKIRKKRLGLKGENPIPPSDGE